MPALTLDVALVHMNRGDQGGNGQYLGVDPYFDDLMLHGRDAAVHVGREDRRRPRTSRRRARCSRMRINRLMTDGVVETPDGAHFTSCVPDYERDEAFQQRVRGAARRRRGVGRVPGQVRRRDRSRVPGQARAGVTRRPMTERTRRAPRCARSRCAECFRGDGEILANPIGTIPMIGGRLAKATFEPELVHDRRRGAARREHHAGRRRRPRRRSSRAGTRTARCSTWCGRAGAT